mgnify:CR=1 FL=1
MNQLGHRRHFYIDDLEPLIELSYHLSRIRFTGKIFMVNGLNLAALTQRDAQQTAAARDGLPSWVMFAGFEGCGLLPEEKVQYLVDDLKDLAASYGLQPQTGLAGVEAEGLYRLLMQPSPDPYWKLRPAGGFRDVFFLTTQGKTPDRSRSPADLAEEFAGLRAESFRALAGIGAADLVRSARHQELGVVTLNEMVHEWAAHDLMHTVQAERALMQPFILESGPWLKYFIDHVAL